MKLNTLMVFTACLLRSFNLASISLSKGDIALASTFNTGTLYEAKNDQNNKNATLHFTTPL